MNVGAGRKRVAVPKRLRVLLVAIVCSGLCCGGVASGRVAPPGAAASTQARIKKSSSDKKKSTKSASKPAAGGGSKSAHGSARTARATATKSSRTRKKSTLVSRVEAEKNLKLKSAFVASSQLRPMAQQLASTRSPEAYRGVETYAREHTGEAAAAAYLALGHAYSLDRRYVDAMNAFRQANSSGEVLDDYADFLGAQAAYRGNRGADAYAALEHFQEKYPDSIFVQNAPLLLANLHLQQNDGTGAIRILAPLEGTPAAAQADYLYTLARAFQQSGDSTRAGALFREIFVKHPLGTEAPQARQQMQSMGLELSPAELKVHADHLFNAKRYSEASEQYHEIARNSSSLSASDRDALAIYAAVCDLKLKHLSRREVEKLPDTSDDSAALKMYMMSELQRNEGDTGGHDRLVTEMESRFPTSRWLEEALYSGGNMYLLRHDWSRAAERYSQLSTLFPTSTYAPSAHWRWAWMNYRMRRYSEAARLMEEQIVKYSAGIEVPSALYWRARMLEEQESNLPAAYAFYRALSDSYCNFYYADLARKRMRVLGPQPANGASAVLSAVRKPREPALEEVPPDDDPHLTKAKLLANAALNEYIAPEISASPTASSWGDLAQAEIYASFNEYSRALQSMKRSGIQFFSQPVARVPATYWHLLFPQPYWSDLVEDSERNGLDPYLVASLIRQESEFNAKAVSHANAYGLMQLLPSVGKSMAKQQGLKPFDAGRLLDPKVNLQLGTANLKQVLNRFGGQVEYALAAYNAGDTPVRQWIGSSEYKDIPEFVESIPYTETREYVQAILRNRELYRELYPLKSPTL